MANRARGEVSIKVGRKRYTFRPTITAYCELEDRFPGDLTHVEILTKAAQGNARAMMAVIWSYLQAKHADEIVEFADAGRLIDSVGMEEVQAQMERLQAANAPDESDTQNESDAAGESADAGDEGNGTAGMGGRGSGGPRAVPA